ncbi:hypothetical protein [Pinirhizobacter soli]|uniref:hypothetical protein n=1 Tax=Pinirhizobacter soli TaxID=2786953 RepID=UPI002029EB49|nr:hypothetical protein [Pinirhizobacter soli]
MDAYTISTARSRFFNEDQEAPSAFTTLGWRGAVLYRDCHGVQRMPRILWDAICAATRAHAWRICGYSLLGEDEDEEPCHLIAAEYEKFADDKSNPAIESPVWVAYDSSETWAVLADTDTTTFGCASEVATAIDGYLDNYGTSLRKLTESDYGPAEEWSYLESVLREKAP